MRDQSQRRRNNSKYGKSGSKKRGKKPYGKQGGSRSGRNGGANGNTLDAQQNDSVCVKCGFPAPDGKLCNFHRSLLNALRNDFGKKGSRNYSPAI